MTDINNEEMVVIYVDNVYLKISGLSKSEEHDLWNVLSFEVQQYGLQHPVFRHLYNKKTKKSYAGLLPYVIEFMVKNHIEYQLIDTRKKPISNADFKLVDYIDEQKTIPFAPRPYQLELIDNLKDRGIVQAATGAGKCLPLSTEVLTVHGFKQMKDVHVGDIVFDKNGQQTTVVGEYPQGVKTIYTVEFDDGTIVNCDKEHLWEYNSVENFSEYDNKVNTLEHILLNEDINNVVIPICKPVRFNVTNALPITSYNVGVLLSLKNVKNDILTDNSNCLLYQLLLMMNKSNGFVPKEYLMSSVLDRLSLIQGAMDMNGIINNGILTWFTYEEQFAYDMRFMLQSVGYRCSKVSQQNNKYIITIDNYNDALFTDKQHISTFKSLNMYKKPYMRIKSITKTDKQEEMKCIMVDSPTHTYLCQDFVVTHNTCMMAQIIAKHNVKPVMIFADKISLCQQIQSEISKFLGTEVGIVGDGIKDYKDITVCSLLSSEEEYIKNAKLALFDECLTSTTKVTCEDKDYTIGEIVNNHLSVKVLSYDINNGETSYKPITGYLKKPTNKRMLRVLINIAYLGNEEIICTDNHQFYTSNRGYVEAKDLQPKDMFITAYGTATLEDITDYTEQFSQQFDTFVYDIEVQDNHNFYANNVLVSNCHHIPSNTCMEVANKCVNAYYRYGMSATPWRDSGDDMLIEAALSKKGNTNINASKLIELGYLIKPLIMFVPVKEVFKGKNYQDIYNQAIVNNERRNKMIYRIAKKMRERNHKILILIKNIKHGEKIQEELLKMFGETVSNVNVINPKNNKEQTVRVKNVEFLSGADETARRKAVIEGMKQGLCDVMIASSVADEGLDLPILDTLILAGGGKSSTRAFQRVGRVIRLYKDKQKAFVFDFVDYTPMLRRHSRVRQKLYQSEPLWDISMFNVDPDAED